MGEEAQDAGSSDEDYGGDDDDALPHTIPDEDTLEGLSQQRSSQLLQGLCRTCCYNTMQHVTANHCHETPLRQYPLQA